MDLKEGALVETELIYSEDKKLFIVTKAIILHQDCQRIGLPIKFDKQVRENPQGSNMIPLNILTKANLNGKKRENFPG